MNEKEWTELFDLIWKAINLNGMTASEKGEEVRSQATANGSDGDLEEFVSMVGISE